MLPHRLRRCPGIGPALDEHLVFAGLLLFTTTDEINPLIPNHVFVV